MSVKWQTISNLFWCRQRWTIELVVVTTWKVITRQMAWRDEAHHLISNCNNLFLVGSDFVGSGQCHQRVHFIKRFSDWIRRIVAVFCFRWNSVEKIYLINRVVCKVPPISTISLLKLNNYVQFTLKRLSCEYLPYLPVDKCARKYKTCYYSNTANSLSWKLSTIHWTWGFVTGFKTIFKITWVFVQLKRV